MPSYGSAKKISSSRALNSNKEYFEDQFEEDNTDVIGWKRLRRADGIEDYRYGKAALQGSLGGLYSGGSAQMVENSLNIHGDEILYVGDHIYTDVSQSKVHLRWRTALICRELEEEYSALIKSRDSRGRLIDLINQKEVVGDLFNQLRLAHQRRIKGRPAQTLAATKMNDDELTECMQKLLIVMQRLDQKIAPMLETDGELFNTRWGYLSRAGLWDKSHIMRQIEKYADIYTSRVSNFLQYTPFVYFRSQEQTLAHDSHSYNIPRPPPGAAAS